MAREVIRRIKLGEGDRRIARDLGASRNTVAKYREWAGQAKMLDSPDLPEPGVIEERLKALRSPSTPGPASMIEPYRPLVLEHREKGVEIRALHAILKDRGFEGSYSSLRRFVGRLEEKSPETFLRVETPPGEEAQVDFGYAGLFHDHLTNRPRKAWVFVMTLSYSRQQYMELVFDQKAETCGGAGVQSADRAVPADPRSPARRWRHRPPGLAPPSGGPAQAAGCKRGEILHR